jgi:hypothetical protein
MIVISGILYTMLQNAKENIPTGVDKNSKIGFLK